MPGKIRLIFCFWSICNIWTHSHQSVTCLICFSYILKFVTFKLILSLTCLIWFSYILKFVTLNSFSLQNATSFYWFDHSAQLLLPFLYICNVFVWVCLRKNWSIFLHRIKTDDNIQDCLQIMDLKVTRWTLSHKNIGCFVELYF